LIDLEDTLWTRKTEGGIIKQGTPFDVPQNVLDLLNMLAEDHKNEVWVLSGLPIASAMDKIAEKAPGIGLIAENGCFVKTIGTREDPSKWINMVANFNLTWKSACMEILNYFTERTPGSFIEERQATVVWRFWSGRGEDVADRQWALRQAAEAQNHIFDSLGERYGLRIIPGANSFLVLPNNISRSSAIGAILHPGGPARSPLGGRSTWMSIDTTDSDGPHDVDFMLVIGSDEKLLRRLSEVDNAETCSTSAANKGTDAKWRIEMSEVIDVLWQFANVAH
jgi:trehalose 6-phosphate synthase/phosphatase